jgi:hypothetical protein
MPSRGVGSGYDGVDAFGTSGLLGSVWIVSRRPSVLVDCLDPCGSSFVVLTHPMVWDADGWNPDVEFLVVPLRRWNPRTILALALSMMRGALGRCERLCLVELPLIRREASWYALSKMRGSRATVIVVVVVLLRRWIPRTILALADDVRLARVWKLPWFSPLDGSMGSWYRYCRRAEKG